MTPPYDSAYDFPKVFPFAQISPEQSFRFSPGFTAKQDQNKGSLMPTTLGEGIGIVALA